MKKYQKDKFIIGLLLISFVFFFTKCEKPGEENSSQTGTRCDNSSTNRIGAICNDGTRSSATGSGACSHHGGVNYWLCN
jgi:hypothetical protein